MAAITLSSDVSGGTWSISNSNATVGSTGIVTGVNLGTATVSYSVTNDCGTDVSTTVITVTLPPIGGPLSISGTGSTTLTNSTSGGSWSVSCPTIATVTSGGVVTGVSRGMATVTYSLSGSTVTAVVTVNSTTSAITGTATVCEGAGTTLAHSAAGGSWSSSDDGTATVNAASGIVTGAGAGTATITYSFDACASTATVTVNPATNGGTITGSSSVMQGATTALSNATTGGTWSASNGNATVSSTGVVTGVAVGTVTISYTKTGTCGTATATKLITVTTPVEGIEGGLTVCVGSATSLTNATTGGTWSAGNTRVTIGSASGIATGVTAGTVVISYHVSSFYTTAIMTVHPLPANITGTLSACAGGNMVLSSTTTGGSWSSSNTSVATVSAGTVSAVNAGTATISYMLSTGCARSVTVTVNAAPAAISGTASVCVGQTTSLSTASTGGTWSSSHPTIANIAPTGIVTGMAAGTANITYSMSGGCKAYTIVTVNGQPSGILGTLKACVGASTTLSNSTSGGSWSVSNSNATVGASTGIVTGASAGTVTVSYITPAGCYKTAIVTINATPSPISGTLSVCVGATTSLGSTPSGGTWASSSTAVATVNSGTGVATGASTGTANVTYTSAAGCFTTAEITVNTLPPAISGTASVCAGSSATLSSGSGTWSSSVTTVATIDGTTGIATGISAGVTIITYSEGAGCNRTRSLTVNPLPAAIGGSATTCIGTTTLLTSATSGGTWSSDDTAIAKISATGVVTGMGSGSANITYTAATGCKATRMVTINTSPDAITGTLNICAGATTVLASTTTSGTWSSSNTSKAAIDSTGLVTGISTGTVTITYTAGCITTATVTVNSIPSVISGSLSICAGGSTALSATPSGGTWSSSDALVATIDGTTGIAEGVTAGTSTITYTSTSGCTRTATLSVNSAPAAIGGTATVCVGQTTSLTNSTGGGTWSSSTPTAANINASTGVVTGIAAGTSTVTYNLGGSCRATAVVTVNAVPGTISGTAIVCAGTSTTLGNSVSGGTWSAGNSNATVDGTAGIVTGVASGTSVITYTTGLGCYSTKVVTINGAPSAIGGTAMVCVSGNTTLTNSTGGGTWSSGNTAIATVNSGTGVVSGISAGNAVITYTTGTGCISTITVTVNGVPATITGPSNVCIGRTMTLANTVSGGAWTSSNGNVTVDGTTGAVTGITAGTSVITYATGAGCFKTKIITINNNPGASGGYKIACVGLTTSLTNGSGGTWTSSNTSIATTTVGGSTTIVTGVATGTANITFTNSTTGCYNVTEVTVNAVPPAITGGANVCVSLQTTLANTQAGGSWSSSNTAYANVGSATGIVTAGTVGGQATISYSFGANCRVTRVVTVRPIPNVISGPATICGGATVTYISSTTGGTWSSSNTAAATVVAGSSPSYGAVTGVAPGVTTLSYSTAPSCTRTLSITVAACRGANTTGVDNTVGNTSVSLYPNPTTGIFTVSAHDAGALSVYTLDGRELAKYEVTKGETQISLPTEFARGIYMCRYNGNDGSTVMVRLVVE
jgi:uncharacterized protein YjdB